MADDKSTVKMNKMIHKKSGASFLVVYLIYFSLVYTDSKKTASCLLPRHAIFATFERQFESKSAIAAAGEFELMFTNIEVHKIVRISKTN